MRKKVTNGAIAVQAIAGTYVVLLGIDLAEASSAGVLGFAIERLDHTEDERYWLKGFRTFEETDPSLPPGSLVSSLEHPIQAFLWGDFTAKPKHDYTYRIVALRGKPKKLEPSETVEVNLATEAEAIGSHAVYFNRGVAGSQAYARKFKNLPPAQVPHDRAWEWLSRGLVEALLAFIQQAKGSQYELRAALYEFQYLPVLQAFGAAQKTGAAVKIIFDAKPNGQNYPNQANREAIAAAKIETLTLPREANPSYIAHNKFIVLLKDGKPPRSGQVLPTSPMAASLGIPTLAIACVIPLLPLTTLPTGSHSVTIPLLLNSAPGTRRKHLSLLACHRLQPRQFSVPVVLWQRWNGTPIAWKRQIRPCFSRLPLA